MNILVAGGAGFIGSHLCDALLKYNNNIICVDNLSIGVNENISHLNNNKNFKFENIDINDFNSLDNVFKKNQFDFIYHLAANSDIQASAKDPDIEFKNTLTSTYNLLSLMRIHNIKKIFFASTSAVYGEVFDKKLDENLVPLKPISYYGASKLSSEALIHAFSYMNEFYSLIFRFPNVIGPRLTHGVIYDFISKLKENDTKLEILGDGTQCKPYMYIDDLINGIIKLSNNLSQGVDIYNIGVESSTTVTRIAEIVVKEMEIKNIIYNYSGGKTGWKGDVSTFRYDLSKIHETGWKAQYTSDEAVLKTVSEVLKSCKQ